MCYLETQGRRMVWKYGRKQKLNFSVVYSFQFWFNLTKTHCSYFNIYISWKIRLCVVDLEGQFQTTLQAKDINFLIWKFRSIILIFLLFFAGVVKSSAFCTLLMLFQRVEILELQFDAKTWLKLFNLLGIASTVCKKHWIWQLLQ